MIEELQNILKKARKKMIVVEPKFSDRGLLREIDFVESSLKREARYGNNFIKVSSGSISDEAIGWFKREGFIVYENSVIVNIKIPPFE